MTTVKHLQVLVNGVEYVNAEFAEIAFVDGVDGVRVEARPEQAKRPARKSTSSGLLEMLTNASKSRTEAVRREKAASLTVADDDDEVTVIGEVVTCEDISS